MPAICLHMRDNDIEVLDTLVEEMAKISPNPKKVNRSTVIRELTEEKLRKLRGGK